MVRHAQTIRRVLSTNCLSVFDHLLGLGLKELKEHCYENLREVVYFGQSIST